MSRFGDVEAQGLTRMQAVANFGEAKIVPAGTLLMYRPEIFPAVAVVMNKATRLQAVEGQDELQINGRVIRKYRAELGIYIYAASDGVTLGDARLSAWSLADAATDAFAGAVFTIGGAPQSGGATVWPATVGDIENFGTDTGQAGVYFPVSIDFQYGIG